MEKANFIKGQKIKKEVCANYQVSYTCDNSTVKKLAKFEFVNLCQYCRGRILLKRSIYGYQKIKDAKVKEPKKKEIMIRLSDFKKNIKKYEMSKDLREVLINEFKKLDLSHENIILLAYNNNKDYKCFVTTDKRKKACEISNFDLAEFHNNLRRFYKKIIWAHNHPNQSWSIPSDADMGIAKRWPEYDNILFGSSKKGLKEIVFTDTNKFSKKYKSTQEFAEVQYDRKRVKKEVKETLKVLKKLIKVVYNKGRKK